MDDIAITDEVIEKTAERILEHMDRYNGEKVTMTFRIPEEKQEAELALKSVEMSIVLWNLLMKRSLYRHTDDQEEYEFWERFSDVVREEIEEYNIMHLIDQ